MRVFIVNKNIKKTITLNITAFKVEITYSIYKIAYTYRLSCLQKLNTKGWVCKTNPNQNVYEISIACIIELTSNGQ